MQLGFRNELEFVKYFNGKKVKELDKRSQKLVKMLFPDIYDEDIIRAGKYPRRSKVDIVISFRGEDRGISIKSGSENSVHIESIDNFTHYIGVVHGLQCCDELKRYMYADGTTDNTGEVRISALQYRKKHADEIQLINDELQKLSQKLTTRFLTGVRYRVDVAVDAFIHGTPEFYYFATADEVLDYLEKQGTTDSEALCINGLYIQNWNRNLSRKPELEDRRECIQVKWYDCREVLAKLTDRRSTIGDYYPYRHTGKFLRND